MDNLVGDLAQEAREAVGGLLECVQEWGQMRMASPWATVARAWLDGHALPRTADTD